MKTSFRYLFLFIFLCTSFAATAQEKKKKRTKTTWTGNGFIHTGIRPGSWEIEPFAANPDGGKVYKNGAQGSNSPVYLAVEQMTQFVYWNMDMSMMFGKKSYEFTDPKTTKFFEEGADEGKYQTAQASILGSLGYLWHGRWGFYLGYRVGYDNNIIKYNVYKQGGAYMGQLGGAKNGINFHFFIPIRHSMFRMSFYNDNLKNGEFNLKAKAHETEFNLCIPMSKSKNTGLMLKWNKMSYSTTDYNPTLKALNGGAKASYNRSYFQIGFVLPIIKELAPGDCEACSGKGRSIDVGQSTKCNVCLGKGGKTCESCGGGGRIYSADRTNSNYCPGCHGSGTINCRTCAGSGYLSGDISYKNCEFCKGSGKNAKK